MRTAKVFLTLGLAAACAAGTGAARGQALLPGGVMAESFLDAGGSNAPDAKQYADGTKAIRESRWADAVKVFDAVAEQKGPHAAGALYWKAYAESKLGDAGKVLESCAALRNQYVGSTWIDDCGALEIEYGAKNGQPVQPQQGQSDELKLLALAGLMQKDPTRARAQIEEIMAGDTSERLKEGALFILGMTQPDASNPEIVRISYLEGEVRIARTSKNEGGKNATWETAVMNLPLEEGDNLVTGKDGRVEIEFEDDSTVYMAENSVLSFQELSSTSGVPHSELALVSGAATLRLDSLMPGEAFVLRTPANVVLARYPEKIDMRVSSYLDGTAVTPLTPGRLDFVGGGGQEFTETHKTFLFEPGHKTATAAPEQTQDFQAFDAWVADRFEAQSKDTAEVMQEAGLQRPVPGLAQMKGQGAFYDCQPYGKCWEPTPQKPMVAGNTGGSGGPAAPGYGPMDEWFPCMPWAMGYGYGVGYTYATGFYFQPALPMPASVAYPVPYGMYPGMDPYAWAVCHAGYWLPQPNGRYAWVAGKRIHHHAPVKWVRFGKTVAAVPIHPKDVKGQPPLNRERGFTVEKGKQGFRVTSVKFDDSHPLELMKEAPREFRNEESAKLARTEAPLMEAHNVKDGSARAGMARAGVPLTFNPEQGFMSTREVMQNGRTVAVSTPVGRSGAVMGGHAGASAGFGASGGFHSVSSGGGFHGSSGGGGGAFHGGTTTSTTSSSSSVSSSSASSSSASGGSHK